MQKTRPTKHNFTLGQEEMDYLSWVSQREMRTVNNSLRFTLRELYNKHKNDITVWKIEQGQPASSDDEVDAMLALAGDDTDQSDEAC